jgi:hypothetical protein
MYNSKFFFKKRASSTPESRKSAELFLQSSELGLPHSLARRRVCSPLLRFGGGGGVPGTHSLAGEGVGGFHSNSDEGTDTVVL